MEEFGIIMFGSIFLGLFVLLGAAIGSESNDESSYRNGQLDYQRGVIEYELTEDGYRQLVKEVD